MSKTVTITVTKEDIEKGVMSECDKCPIALAVARVGVKLPRVFASEVFFDDPDVPALRIKAKLPPAATRFICDFDEDEPVSPFSFDLELP